MIPTKHEIILDTYKRRNRGESIRSIAASYGISHTTLNNWLAAEGGPRTAELREGVALRVNNLFRQGLSATKVSEVTRIPLRTVESLKSTETKALLKTEKAALYARVVEQLALGMPRHRIAAENKLTYTNVCRIAREAAKK